jgi:pimeloyl-ACP methyl ester carboxylesterase
MPFERKEAALASGPLPYLVAGDGPALLYLHPAGGPMETKFLQGLAAAHRVHIPIMPGFAGTLERAGVATIPDLADLAAEFAATTIGRATDVMGASFGGWIALWLALRHPGAVEQLVLEAPAGLAFGVDPATFSPEEARRKLFLFPEKATGLAPLPEIAAANAAAFRRYNKGALVDQELAGRVAGIKARTLVLMATADATIPPATGHFLAARIPACHLSYIYNAAHALEVDQPEAALRLVRAFLERGDAYVVNLGREGA